ncbi:alcohol dehydrogenase [Anaerovorax odorimutans]|uniref:Alcohol dehydrogenase n=1 Tax=Anaerovorax odorimutans TaxID=109327 RepID=A0ABT1RLK1_9FIRM|nr:alcohol dehydrogenase [Anaerovorax odorimutans]MCQ4636058.1 alcohol dehydrogenase [Anaerovorax odorimutans]
MKAFVYKGNHELKLEERPRPRLQSPKDAIVRVTLASICSSDLHIKHGAVPKAIPGVILGHEMVGVVEETGTEVSKVRPGDRVTINVETFCGECFYCRRGLVNNCQDPDGGWALGCRIDGGQAEYVRVPYADNGLNRIPDSVTDQQALFTGDILSTGYWAADLAEIKKDDTVVILGAGSTGLCAAMCAALYEPKNLILAEIDCERADFARQLGIPADVVDPQDLKFVISDKTAGRGADSVIEAAGGAGTFDLAWQLARPSGIVCLVAMYEENQILPLPHMYGKNLTFKTGGVHAAHCDRLLRLIADSRLDTTGLITHTFAMEDILEAYDLFEKRLDGVMKIAIEMNK